MRIVKIIRLEPIGTKHTEGDYTCIEFCLITLFPNTQILN